MSQILNDLGEAYRRIDSTLQAGDEAALPAVNIGHYPIADTALAAALLTLGIPWRNPGPYTDDVQLDAKGNEVARRIFWWVGAKSNTGAEEEYVTEFILGAWDHRERFEADHPLHPLVSMRAGHDARNWWVSVMIGREPLPTSVPPTIRASEVYVTDSIHAAATLKACGYAPVAIVGTGPRRRAFVVRAYVNGVHAEQLLHTAALAGNNPAGWIALFLYNYSHLIGIAKRQSTIIREPVEDQTLMLTADSTPQTRAKFHALL